MAVENSILQMLLVLPKIMYLTYPAPLIIVLAEMLEEVQTCHQILLSHRLLPERQTILLQLLDYHQSL